MRRRIVIPLLTVLLVALVAAGYTLTNRSAPPALHGVKLMVSAPDGGAVEAVIERRRYDAFAAETAATIRAVKKQAADAVTADLDRELTALSDSMAPGIDAFADWYFTWGTSQELLWAAARAYGTAVAFNSGSPGDAAADAMRQAFENRFISLVLQPDINSQRLEAALQRVAGAARNRYAMAAGEVDKAALRLVQESAWDPATADSAFEVVAVVDLTRSGPLSGSGDTKSGGLPTISGDFSSLVRKALIETAEKTIAANSTVFLGPFLTIFTSAAATSSAAGGTSALFTGPLAPFVSPEILVATYVLSAMVDYGITRASDLATRTEFVAGAQGTLAAVRSQWLAKFRPEYAAYSDTLHDNLAGTLRKMPTAHGIRPAPNSMILK